MIISFEHYKHKTNFSHTISKIPRIFHNNWEENHTLTSFYFNNRKTTKIPRRYYKDWEKKHTNKLPMHNMNFASKHRKVATRNDESASEFYISVLSVI